MALKSSYPEACHLIHKTMRKTVGRKFNLFLIQVTNNKEFFLGFSKKNLIK
jgi:hypothetical protein